MMMARQRVILFACGCYNPPQIMHLRMFELARDFLSKHSGLNVVGGIISPVHDAYGKAGLVEGRHRIEMVKLATESSDWLKVSAWETSNEGWSRTRAVMDHHQNQLNAFTNGSSSTQESWMPDSLLTEDRSPIKLKLLCGADVLDSFNIEGLWTEQDMTTLVKDYGIVVITRQGNDPWKSIYNNDILSTFQGNISIIREWISNDVSSTRVRQAVRRENSVKYFVPDSVIDYIKKEQLYLPIMDAR